MRVGYLEGGDGQYSQFPQSNLQNRDQESYAAKYGLQSIKNLWISDRVSITPYKITDFTFQNDEKSAVICSNNGDLLLGCGFAIAKAVVNAAGAGLQQELYDRFGIPSCKGVSHYGHKNYNATEGRGYAIDCGAYDMEESHGVNKIIVVTVPDYNESGVHNMYFEAFQHAKDLDFIVVPLAGNSHPVLRDKPQLNALLVKRAWIDFIEKYPHSKLKIIFALADHSDVLEVYQNQFAIINEDEDNNF